ncbi:MAG: hypothetical protein J7K26_02190 [Candidatus Aenigmarchaeota archaeon]|nr:hypothetical protein [Candidatus Aenigmarchaeota archaeon]
MKKGSSTIIQAVLIFAIATALAAFALPWAYNSLQKSLDIMEINKIKKEFEICNDKLIDTARTGTSNRCLFSVKRGGLVVEQDGIYYTIQSKSNICDEQAWTPINLEKHLWQRCDKDIKKKILKFKWYYPKDVTIQGTGFNGDIIVDQNENNAIDIKFDKNIDFITLTVVIEFEFTEGQQGNIVDISRLSITDEKTVLNIKVS